MPWKIRTRISQWPKVQIGSKERKKEQELTLQQPVNDRVKIDLRRRVRHV